LERWARLFVSAAPDLLALVLDTAAMARTREGRLLHFFLAEAPDPNVKRSSFPNARGSIGRLKRSRMLASRSVCKSEAENISAHVLRQIKEKIENG
jgi:hypothetical protein